MAVLPGTLPLSVIRGITFDGVILQCKDDSVLVSGTLSPDVTGVFLPSGTFSGYPMFVLAGAPSTFLYYNPTATTYIIARTLSTGGLTDYWICPDVTEPTGEYTPAGAYSGTATATDNPVDLTGYTPEAVVKRKSDSDVVLDLNPSLTDAANGEITIPAIAAAGTEDFDFIGSFNWDLVLTLAGERFGPFVRGPFTVSDNITQP